MANVDGGNIVWNLDVDDAKFTAGMNKASQTAKSTAGDVGKSAANVSDGIGAALDKAKGASLAFAGVLAAAGAAAVAFGVTSVKAYNDQATANKQTEAVLESTAKARMGVYTDVAVSTQKVANTTADFTDKLNTATAKLHDMQERMSKTKDPTETATLALQKQTETVAKLQAQAETTTTTYAQKFNPAMVITAKYVSDLSTQFEKTTTSADETTQAGINMLLTFTHISKTALPQATQAMLDMATAMNGGVTPGAEQLINTAIQLGKALNDPILGVTALRRVGVQLSDQQQQQIQDLVAQNKLYEAQQIILGELTTEFGGSAAKSAQTFQGRIKQLSNEFNNFQENVGQLIESGLTPFLGQIENLVVSMGGADGIFKTLEKSAGSFFNTIMTNGPIVTGIILGGLTPAFYALAGAVAAATIDLLPFVLAGLALGAAVQVIVGQLGGWNKVLADIKIALTELGKAYNTYVKPSVDSLIAQVKTSLIPALQELWKNISPIIVPALKVLGAVVGGALLVSLLLLVKVLSQVASYVTNAANVINTLVESTKKASANLKNPFKEAADATKQFSQIMTGLRAVVVDFFTGGDVTATWYQHFKTSFLGVSIFLDRFRNVLTGTWDIIRDFFTGGDVTATWYDHFKTSFIGVSIVLDNFQNTLIDLPGNALKALQALPGNIATALQQTGLQFVNFLGYITGVLIFGVPKLLGDIVTFFTGLPAQIGAALSSLGTVLSTVWQNVVTGFTTAWTSISTWVTTNIPLIVGGIIAFFAALPGNIMTIITNTYNAVVAGWTNIWTWLSTVVPQIVNSVGAFFAQIPGKISAALTQTKVNAVAGFQATWDAIIKEISTWPDKLFTWGANIGNAFLNGIKSAIDQITNAFKDGLNKAKSVIEGHSPPVAGPFKDIDKWGFNVGSAWVDGVRQAIGTLSLGGPTLNPMPAIAPTTQSAPTQVNSRGVIINVDTMNVHDESDITTLARELGFRVETSPGFIDNG